ncbi:MAG: CAP domain-containing protein, partial [Cellulomonas sp.]|nr:CAP domain-containing protein [Cellulomonas sp.]
AAQQRAAKPAVARTVRSAPAAAAPVGAAAPAPAAAGAGDVFSAGTIGAELNAYRVSQGLGALAIVSSGARVDHAMQMAASNSIWHSTVRSMAEIVGRVSPVSASAMIGAYANSAPHNAIMLGAYSTAYVGAVTYDGWLYTSIQFG